MHPDPLAAQLLRVLAERDIPATVLARRAGIDRNVLTRWLSGERSIRLKHLHAIARVLHLHLTFTEDLHAAPTSLHRRAGSAPPPAEHRQSLS